MSKTYRIAIVVPGLVSRGGLASVADFLFRALEDSDQFEPDLVSIATRSNDPASIQILRPSTWARGVQTTHGIWKGRDYRHVGACLSELEFQRYMPRSTLTETLNRYDLVQIVGGTPAWGLVAKNALPPVALQVATLVSSERTARLNSVDSVLDVWRSLMTRVTAQLDWEGLSQASVVFVENEWMRETLSDNLGEKRIVFAPPGIDTSFFHPKRKSQPSPASSEVASYCSEHDYILSVGRFRDPRKNVELLFDAYAHLREQREDVPPLFLVGRSGPSDAVWERAEQQSIRNHIRFFRDVSKEELALFYREANLFVLSSDEEGLGIAILEAMASGLPVVSTDCGGPATSVLDGKTGLLVPVQNPTTLADGMRKMIDHPDTAREMGHEGRRRAVSEFSEEATRSRFLREYQSLLS